MVRLLLILAFAAAGYPAAAEEEPRWYSDVGEVGAYAKWGIPDTDAVGFEVVCLDGGHVEMRPALYAVEQPMQLPDIRFSIDGEAYVRDAKLGFSKRDFAWQASAVVSKDDAIIDAMRRGSKLTYDFDPPLRDGDAFTLSLSGSAKAIDAALDAC